DARRAVRMQQVSGAVAYQVERRRIGARGCDPVRVLARLCAPLEVGTGEEVGSILIHERARRTGSGGGFYPGKLRRSPCARRFFRRGGGQFSESSTAATPRAGRMWAA